MHDNLKPMENVVSVNSNENKKEDEFVINEDKKDNFWTSEFGYDYKARYRLLRKKISSFLCKQIKKQYINILYITDGTIPSEYITALQKRYPERLITLLVPHFGNFSSSDKFITEFKYFLKNNKQSAKLYKYAPSTNNINIYGIYSKNFSDLANKSDLYEFENLIHYSASVRKAAEKLKPDIIHSENIPFYLGQEFKNSNKHPLKVMQTIHDIETYTEQEPFWAAINCLDKGDMSKLCNDKIIKKNVAALFGIKNVNRFSKMKDCLEYLYINYERYRKTYGITENTNENILINRLNERTQELFGNAFIDKTFSPIFYSIKNATISAINSTNNILPDWAVFDYKSLKRGQCKKNTDKIAHPFNINNFRYYRDYNKQYLIKEFSEKQIKLKFVDLNLFKNNEVKIYGYLDSFYKGTLLFADFHNLKDYDIKTATNAILKCFELKKNIQVIFNVPFNFENSYIISFIDFLEQQSSLNGKWILIEGEINLPQFVAASDIILLPTSSVIGIEDTLFTALQYGCIPVTVNSGICGQVVVDIFEDIKNGFGFKNWANNSKYIQEVFTDTVLKALNFYVQNFTSWKILIENAIKYDSTWNNDLLEEYNKIYDTIL